MTEEYWRRERENIKKNADNVNPILQQTFEDHKNPNPKNFRELYTNCLKGALYLNQYAQSENISIDDMAMLICRDKGCELQYCQASMHDPYEKPFENCDEHYKNFAGCMSAEKRRYVYDGQERTMNQQIEYMLEKKRKEKIINMEIPIKDEKNEKEYFVKNIDVKENFVKIDQKL